MKMWTKCVIGVCGAAILSFGVISLSCNRVKVSGNAATLYAESSVDIPKNDLKIVEALQNSFRAISKGVLPSVVEVDVTETVEVSSPFDDFEDFFFGFPFGNNGDGKKKGKSREREQKGLGSGVIVRRSGKTLYVLTNNHVAGNASKISIKLNDEREFEGKLVGADSRMDIALVSFESDDESIPVAVLGNSDELETGDICFAMGAPLGFAQSVTQGIISAKGRSGSGIGNLSDFIQTDAAINQGNSGGPLVNIYGEVVGINTWIASNSGGSQELGFSIPINNIKNSIDSFIKDGKVAYGWLGVLLIEANPEYKKSLGLENSQGALVSQLFIGSPSYKGGIKPGDFIVSLNGHKVKDVTQLTRDVGLLQSGTDAEFEVIRNGKTLKLSVKIEERSEKVVDDKKLWPGFIASPITDEIREKLDLDKSIKGVIVADVQETTPAAFLRISKQDVITGVNGVKITNLQEFYTELAKADKSINFDIYANGGTITTGTFKF